MIKETKTKSSTTFDPPSGFWIRDSVYHPEPIMPIHHSVFLNPINDSARNSIEKFSIIGKRMEYRDIGGWGYVGRVFFNDDDPELQVRIKGCIENFRNSYESQVIQLWHKEWKPAQKKRIVELQSINLSQFSDQELAAHILHNLKPFLKTSLQYQSMLEFAFAWTIGKLTILCNDFCGEEPEQIIQIMAGLSPEITNPAHRISDITRIAVKNPQIRSLLEQPDNINFSEIENIDPEFASVINKYLNDYGCRIFHNMIHYPTLREEPSILLNLIRNQLIKSFQDPSIKKESMQNRTEWLRKVRAKLQQRSEEDRVSFENTWKNALQVYPLKEDCEYDTFDAPTALMRYALLETGSRMSSRHQLTKLEDVFFLELEEAVQAITENKDVRELVNRRKAERDCAIANPGPPFYGTPIEFSTETLPQEAQVIVNGMEWILSQYYGFKDIEITDSESILTGTAASSGRYTGPARIIMSESDFSKIRAGDVLVCPITTPSWSILFPNIGAIISNAGGLLSHPAIIAREYGLPAVVATRDATQRLSDGQMVTVDGSTGTVEIN